jgi:hypothetical protein
MYKDFNIKNIKKTVIISIYNSNRMVFIPETECVHCAVRTKSLNTIRLILVFKGLNTAISINAQLLPVDHTCKLNQNGYKLKR